MDAACPTCSLARFAADVAARACRSCRSRRGVFARAPQMAGPSGAPPTQRSGPRPKAPEVELSLAEVSVSFRGRDERPPDAERSPLPSEAPISSEPEPISMRDVEVMSTPFREVTASRRLFDLVSLGDGPDGEPVSRSDLEAIFSPGFNPSPRLGTLAPPPVTPAPVATRSPAPQKPPPLHRAPIEERDHTTAKLPPVVPWARPVAEEPDAATAPLPKVATRRVIFEEAPDSPAVPMLLVARRAAPAEDSPAPPSSSEPISSSALIDEPSSSQPISSSALIDAPESAPSQPISSGSILSAQVEIDVDLTGPEATRPSPGVARRPSAHLPFFDVGEVALHDGTDPYATEPAPFDPSVPPLPISMAPPPRSENSGLIDIRGMAEQDAANEEPAPRSDFDLFNLSGGLFEEGASGLGPPDQHLLTLPRAPSLRPSRTSVAPVSQRVIAPVLSPVVSERRPPVAASSSGGRGPWLVGALALLAIAAVVAVRFATNAPATADAKPTVAETAQPPVATERTLPATPQERPIAAPPPAETAKDNAAPAAVTAPIAKTAPVPSTTPAPTRDAPTREPIEKAPPPEKTVAVPEKTATPPPPDLPPSGGADFDKGAAKAALAAAASRAAGCKPADDPGGGAKVSVTFAPSGRVTTSRVTGAPYQGTAIGGCIAAAFRGASVPPFEGSAVTVSKDVNLH